jgi:hypothetical protein
MLVKCRAYIPSLMRSCSSDLESVCFSFVQSSIWMICLVLEMMCSRTLLNLFSKSIAGFDIIGTGCHAVWTSLTSW